MPVTGGGVLNLRTLPNYSICWVQWNRVPIEQSKWQGLCKDKGLGVAGGN